MTLKTPLRLSVSTWALHPLIGTVTAGRPGAPDAHLMPPRAGTLDLLDVPAALAAHGFTTMELCHFHLPTRSDDYLAALRGACEAAGVELWSLLIDDGDITDPEHGDRDQDWIASWVETAGALGAQRTRVIAGKQPYSPGTIEKSIAQLTPLVPLAEEVGVRLLTENWFPTLDRPEAVIALLTAFPESLGLNFDFGNWGGADKYDKLRQIAPYAEGSHAKCDYKEGKPDVADYTACLKITQAAAYSGPYSLVHGEPGRVWESLAEQAALVTPFLEV